MSGNEHAGHRARMKQRYLSQGLDGFSDHEVLELLLYYANPRADVNPAAHRLLEHFGSFRAVLDATPEDVKEVKGLGESAGLLLRLVKDVNRRYLLDLQAAEQKPRLTGAEEAGRFFLPYFYGVTEERIYAAFLDDELQVLSCRLLAEGDLNTALVSVRRLVEVALREKATGVVVAHNHPAGQAVPSLEDREATLKLRDALSAVQIRLLDHIIVRGMEFASMKECGHLSR